MTHNTECNNIKCKLLLGTMNNVKVCQIFLHFPATKSCKHLLHSKWPITEQISQKPVVQHSVALGFACSKGVLLYPCLNCSFLDCTVLVGIKLRLYLHYCSKCHVKCFFPIFSCLGI